ncbi:MAG: D-alanine--D-alanine ligase [bacterium]|jgi:D-alanine-D-alanine ligase|nr:D-alanine--D-alanine ligase [bacterium]MBK7187877.1 D-alanine--D-alanine ligase [bacterium]MBK7672336.1 D-alanine--D-alanine ligase [bacterium]MBK7768954.1 D-alanine--D-alanine ligase [bacterium]
MRVAVLMGGDSSEREVSLRSGQAVAQGLREAGHDVVEVEIASVAAVIGCEALQGVDVVFPALHGGDGEDGHLQALLEVLGYSYALSGPGASALAMDKGLTKRLMRSAGIPTPDWLQVTWNCRPGAAPQVTIPGSGAAAEPDLTLERIHERVLAEIGFPAVVKLNTGGSSVGVEIVAKSADFTGAFERVAAAGGTCLVEVLVEKYIPGRELTAAILLGRRLPLLEIRPREGFYDYRNKYTSGASDYLVPAPVHSPVYEQIVGDALRLYELAGCRGMSRIDFRLDGDAYYCLEINTIPGMTATSLVPKAAAAVGIGFAALVDDLCRAARLPAEAAPGRAFS